MRVLLKIKPQEWYPTKVLKPFFQQKGEADGAENKQDREAEEDDHDGGGGEDDGDEDEDEDEGYYLRYQRTMSENGLIRYINLCILY